MTAPLEWHREAAERIRDGFPEEDQRHIRIGWLMAILSNHDPGPAQISALESRLAEAVGLLREHCYDYPAFTNTADLFKYLNREMTYGQEVAEASRLFSLNQRTRAFLAANTKEGTDAK